MASTPTRQNRRPARGPRWCGLLFAAAFWAPTPALAQTQTQPQPSIIGVPKTQSTTPSFSQKDYEKGLTIGVPGGRKQGETFFLETRKTPAEREEAQAAVNPVEDEEALERDSNAPLPPLFESEEAIRKQQDLALLQRVRILMSTGDHVGALMILEDLLLRYPEDLNISFLLGTTEMNLRRYDRAVFAFERILDKKPAAHPVRLLLAQALLASQQNIRAQEQLDHLYAFRVFLAPSLVRTVEGYRSFLKARMEENLQIRRRPVPSGSLGFTALYSSNRAAVSKRSPVFSDRPDKAAAGSTDMTFQIFWPFGLSAYGLSTSLFYTDTGYFSKADREDNALSWGPSVGLSYANGPHLVNLRLDLERYLSKRKTLNADSFEERRLTLDYGRNITPSLTITVGATAGRRKVLSTCALCEPAPLNSQGLHLFYTYRFSLWLWSGGAVWERSWRPQSLLKDYDGLTMRRIFTSLSYQIAERLNISLNGGLRWIRYRNNTADEFNPPVAGLPDKRRGLSTGAGFSYRLFIDGLSLRGSVSRQRVRSTNWARPSRSDYDEYQAACGLHFDF